MPLSRAFYTSKPLIPTFLRLPSDKAHRLSLVSPFGILARSFNTALASCSFSLPLAGPQRASSRGSLVSWMVQEVLRRGHGFSYVQLFYCRYSFPYTVL